MRIESNNISICVNNLRKTRYIQSDKNEVKENLESQDKLVKKNPEPEVFKDNNENILRFKKVYNKATLENVNKPCNDKAESLTDEELGKVLDKKVYDSCHLHSLGIEYGTKEYEEWKDRWKDNITVPLDAPVRVRKALYDLIDSTEDEITRSNLVFSIADNLEGVDTSDINSYFNLCDKVVSENNKFINDMNLLGMASNSYVKVTINQMLDLNKCLSKFKLDLEDIVDKEI